MNAKSPIVLIVSLSVLAQTKNYCFKHHCSLKELSDLGDLMQVTKISRFSFSGNILQTSSKKYKLSSTLKGSLIQKCVITSNPVKTILDTTIKRYYISAKSNCVPFDTESNVAFSELEFIENELDIGDIIIEALALAIPDYPKKQNVKFNGVTITENGLEPLDKIVNNPFSSLEKLKNK